MRKTLLASASAVALACSSAMPARAVSPPPQIFTWTGFYIGANASAGWGTSNTTILPNVTAPPFFDFAGILTNPPDLNLTGFGIGTQAGYNWQAGMWVFGLESDFSALDVKGMDTKSPFFVGKGGGNSVSWSSRYDWLFTSRVRAGITVAQNWLFYATGGLAVTEVRDAVTCSASGPSCVGAFGAPQQITWSASSTLAGWTVGGGIEAMFLPNWIVRVQYLYAKFPSTTPGTTYVMLGPASPSLPPLSSFTHDLNLVTVAVSYKFGG